MIIAYKSFPYKQNLYSIFSVVKNNERYFMVTKKSSLRQCQLKKGYRETLNTPRILIIWIVLLPLSYIKIIDIRSVFKQ